MANDRITDIKHNNAGLSLVELIVAFAVGLIVAGSITSIIFMSTRMYSRGTSNISGQYEIQTTLNQTVDSIESAQWFAYSQSYDGTDLVNTDYIALGKIGKDSTGKYYFAGEVFTDNYADRVDDRFNVYMNRYEKLELDATADTAEAKAKEVVSGEADTIRGDDQYLLGQDATKYIVTLDTGSSRFIDYTLAPATPTPTPTPGPVVGVTPKGYYENPIMFTVDIEFSKKSMTGDIKKHVSDTVTLRNHLDKCLYIEERAGYYEPKK